MGPTVTRANDEGVGTMLEADPSWRRSNQAAMRVIDGTNTRPFPMPVSRRAAEASSRPLDTPVRSIPPAVTTIPTVITIRGPNLAARTPPTAAINVHPARFQEASEPAAALLIPRASCMEGSTAL
jgi:hypothetical protein